MRLKTLGGLEVETSDFKQPKPLLLLTYLALEGPQVRRYVAELFWLGGANPMNSLTSALTRLRKGLPGVIEADDTKVWTTTLCDAASLLKALEKGELERGLELYKGPFLAGVHLRDWGNELEEWVYSTREILAAKTRTAIITLGEQEASKGNFAQAAILAEKAYLLSEASPLELDDFSRVYTLLHAGSSPLAAEVRQEAESFDIPLELSREKTKGQFRETVEIVADVPHNLPPPKSSFVGREQDLRDIAHHLAQEECRLLTLHGMGGIGKSRTAIEAAYRFHNQGMFKDGIFFIALEGLTSADMIPSAIAESLVVDILGADDVLTQVKSYIANKSVLLILDNFEHLMEGATTSLDLLASCTNLKLLVTSREILNFEEEWVKDLEGLQYPQSLTMPLEEAKTYEAVQLFTQRTKKAVLKFSSNEQNIATIIKICQLVEGAPLALELAATWVRVMSLPDIVKEIQSNLSFLENLRKNRTDRHQSIRAVFEHSWRLLNSKEQTAFSKLAVFVGSFSRQAAAEVAGATLPVLVGLVNKSLLRVMQNGRYSRHFLIYEFSQEKLKGTPSTFAQIKQDHASYYLQYLSSQSEAILGAQQEYVLEQLELEIDNIFAAWLKFFEESDSEHLCMAVTTVSEFLSMKGRAKEGISLYSSSLSSIEKQSNPSYLVLGMINKYVSRFYYEVGNYTKSREFAEKSLDWLEPIADSVTLGPIFRLLASIYRRQGDLVRAKTLYETELSLYKAENDRRALGLTLNNLGVLYTQMGLYEEAENHLLECIGIARQLESIGGLVFNLHSLAILYLFTDKPIEAEAALRESLDIAKRIDYVSHIPFLLNDLAKASYQQGNLDEANQYLREALRKARRMRNEPAMFAILITLARIKIAVSDFTQVEYYLTRALTIGRTLDDSSELYFCLLEVSKYFLKLGKKDLGIQLARFISESSGAWKAVRDQALGLFTAFDVERNLSYETPLATPNSSMKLEKIVTDFLLGPLQTGSSSL